MTFSGDIIYCKRKFEALFLFIYLFGDIISFLITDTSNNYSTKKNQLTFCRTHKVRTNEFSPLGLKTKY